MWQLTSHHLPLCCKESTNVMPLVTISWLIDFINSLHMKLYTFQNIIYINFKNSGILDLKEFCCSSKWISSLYAWRNWGSCPKCLSYLIFITTLCNWINIIVKWLAWGHIISCKTGLRKVVSLLLIPVLSLRHDGARHMFPRDLKNISNIPGCWMLLRQVAKAAQAGSIFFRLIKGPNSVILMSYPPSSQIDIRYERFY